MISRKEAVVRKQEHDLNCLIFIFVKQVLIRHLLELLYLSEYNRNFLSNNIINYGINSNKLFCAVAKSQLVLHFLLRGRSN